MSKHFVRNPIIQTLPAGATLMLDIEPPMDEDERPMILPFRGRGSVVVHVIDNGCLEITNPTNELAPFILVVAKPPRELQRLMTTLVDTLRNR
jgi:hypothetical protein